MTENASHRFDRLPATGGEREIEGRPTREEILAFWTERFGVPSEAFEAYTFWERGNGKIWAFAGELESPVDIEALGLSFMRTRQEHWKPTTEAVQRFGSRADRNVIRLDRAAAERFLAGEDQRLAWDGDWGYLIVTHDIAGGPEPIGVGLYVHGELRSQIPKGRRRDFSGE
ncbi:DUF7122 family protein [Halapricum desulfuricans]|uniref:Ribosome biogenesis protein, NOL1/NOP2/fmu family n=1 Tax=Halapricum desulfuricans TaxID=2841257 RepID=A0A897MYI5_9EURY|nr:hypothetical protein [Halapricum desulfuricans]QSG05341.1 Ribosome biogenesis protein, NOL1/NOP2/fmu family [Halapricum desulfuricans]